MSLYIMYKIINISGNTETFCKLLKFSARIRFRKQGTINSFFAPVDSSFETDYSTF